MGRRSIVVPSEGVYKVPKLMDSGIISSKRTRDIFYPMRVGGWGTSVCVYKYMKQEEGETKEEESIVVDWTPVPETEKISDGIWVTDGVTDYEFLQTTYLCTYS